MFSICTLMMLIGPVIADVMASLKSMFRARRAPESRAPRRIGRRSS